MQTSGDLSQSGVALCFPPPSKARASGSGAVRKRVWMGAVPLRQGACFKSRPETGQTPFQTQARTRSAQMSAASAFPETLDV
jgi:hypothetical protein